MGKGQCKAGVSKTYVLKLDMHCQCNGCVKKMKDAVKEMMSLSQGVERADVSAEAEAGEVRVEVTGGIDMDPAKLCCLLQEATKKKRVRIAEEASVPSPGRQTTLSGQGSGRGCWWLAARWRGHLPYNRPDPERPAGADARGGGGGMERDDGAFGALPVPLGGACQHVRCVGCIGHHRDVGHVVPPPPMNPASCCV